MVGLVLTAAVALLATTVVSGARAAAAMSYDRGEDESARVVHPYLLRDVFLHARTTPAMWTPASGRATLTGTEDRMVFDSLGLSRFGTRERCVVELSIHDGEPILTTTSSTLAYRLETRAAVVFRYQQDTSRTTAGVWLREWKAGLTAPKGVALVGERDTVVFRLGSAQ
jgi:hypothetical protein